MSGDERRWVWGDSFSHACFTCGAHAVAGVLLMQPSPVLLMLLAFLLFALVRLWSGSVVWGFEPVFL